MTTSLPVLRSSLDALSSGDLDIREARSAVRRAIGAGAGMVEHAYVSLRGAAWRMISARQATEDLEEWYDIYTHAAALARREERPDIAERLTTLAELVAQTGRFADRQPLDEVLERRHVKDLLVELLRNGGSARRVLLADATELADANLSRVLAILGAHGLILRRRSGKEALLSLTQAGCAAAAKVGAPGISSASMEDTRWWEGLDVPVALWTADGHPIGSSSAFRELMSKAGYHGPSTLDWRAWTDWVESALQDEHSDSNVSADNVEARVLQLSDGHWVRYAEQCFPDGATCVWLLDVSAEKQAEASLLRELRARDDEIAKLKERTAKAERKAEEHKRRLQSFVTEVQLRSDVLNGTVSVTTRLRSRLGVVHDNWRSQLEDVDRQVVAIKQHLLPDPLKPKPARELLDPRALIEQSVEIVSTLSGSQFEKYFYDIKQVRARTPAVRAAICHAMLTLLRESNAQKYLLSTKVEDKTLFVLLLGLNGLRGQQPADFDHYAQLKSDEDLLMHGYSYCRDLVQLVGGKVSAGIEKRGRGWRSFVQMTFPVEAAKVRTFGEGAG